MQYSLEAGKRPKVVYIVPRKSTERGWRVKQIGELSRPSIFIEVYPGEFPLPAQAVVAEGAEIFQVKRNIRDAIERYNPDIDSNWWELFRNYR
ncbi:hypothetical protein A2Y99_01970 [Candidatus Gottesmanbacteria bacterium RBG_13_37_7]|uniref:Uncharacterized protein n=1 Tax=Candidatus Gottesmanbacteria bacterium RBG_13_37_7 TaxID=1798369 RepID=A0A1F5YID0_9BACT|nr:MAG: hypothetical protein A2Y99_01970 [Candidatus Gottesmanbacteria bacterium RBG_13_37_7]